MFVQYPAQCLNTLGAWVPAGLLQVVLLRERCASNEGAGAARVGSWCSPGGRGSPFGFEVEMLA